VALRSYRINPASESMLTKPVTFQEAVRWSQSQQGSGTESYSEQGPEVSPTSSGIPTGPDLQCDPRHPSLLHTLQARQSDLYT